jgi:hypothetical protein
LTAVQGDSIVAPDTTGNGGGTDTTTVQTARVHNFTTDGKTSSFFTITGNLSTSKGTVVYQGLTLTQCLKIESTTSIAFTLAQPGNLTLVFNPEFVGKISVNGTACTAVGGIVTKSLPAGSVQILKTDAANLYYLSISTSTALDESTKNKACLFCNTVDRTLSVSNGATILGYELYDTAGTLLRKSTHPAKTIALGNLPKCSYIVQALTNEGRIRQIILP